MSDKKFTVPQMDIVAEIVQAYGTDPNDITFFTETAEPFIGYETACVMLNRLIPDLQGIDAEPIFQASADSVSIKIILTDAKGRVRSGLGTVNKGEKDGEGNPLGSQQMQYIAMSRGLRSAMRMAGIDLMRLHNAGDTVAEFTGNNSNDERNRLLREAHALGEEVGYINEGNKSLWQSFLMNRYGCSSTGQMSDELIADTIAALRAIRPPARRAA